MAIGSNAASRGGLCCLLNDQISEKGTHGEVRHRHKHAFRARVRRPGVETCQSHMALMKHIAETGLPRRLHGGCSG